MYLYSTRRRSPRTKLAPHTHEVSPYQVSQHEYGRKPARVGKPARVRPHAYAGRAHWRGVLLAAASERSPRPRPLELALSLSLSLSLLPMFASTPSLALEQPAHGIVRSFSRSIAAPRHTSSWKRNPPCAGQRSGAKSSEAVPRTWAWRTARSAVEWGGTVAARGEAAGRGRALPSGRVSQQGRRSSLPLSFFLCLAFFYASRQHPHIGAWA